MQACKPTTGWADPAPSAVERTCIICNVQRHLPCTCLCQGTAAKPASSNRPVQTSKPQSRPGQPAPATGILAAKPTRSQRRGGETERERETDGQRTSQHSPWVFGPLSVKGFRTSHHAHQPVCTSKTYACTMLRPPGNVSRSRKHKTVFGETSAGVGK